MSWGYCFFFFLFNKLKVYDNPSSTKSIGGFFSQKHYLFSLCLFNILVLLTGFPGGPEDKVSACNARDPGRKIPWRRQWQPTPVILPGRSHGWRSLVGYSPCGRKESDTAERLHFHFLSQHFKLLIITIFVVMTSISDLWCYYCHCFQGTANHTHIRRQKCCVCSSAPSSGCSPVSLHLLRPPYSLRHSNTEIRPMNNS